jgi:branched-chain amino acid transport system permease protein
MAQAHERPRLPDRPPDEQRSPLMQRALKFGLIGGAVVLYCGAIGIFQRFDERELVAGVVSLGRALLLIISFVFGYLTARPRPDHAGVLERHAPGAAVLAGVTAGAVTGAVSALFVLIASTGNLQSMFLLVTDALVDVLSFGAGAGGGAVILVVVGAVMGGLGAASTLLAENVRKLVFTTLLIVIAVSLGEALLNTFFTNLFYETYLNTIIQTNWFFSSGALTIAGAILVAALVIAGKTIGRGRLTAARERMRSAPRERQRITRTILVMVLIAVLLYVPQLLGLFMSEVVGTVGIYILLGLGLNIVVGYAGLLDLGYVAFFAIAAYAMAILTSPQGVGGLELSFWVALPIVVAISTLGGILLGAPVLRLRGDYLAIVTLGFGEIIRIVAISDWAKPVTGGAQGITQIPDIAAFGTELDNAQTLYYVIFAVCLIAAFISLRLQGSRVGRAWNALREDESVAEAMGVSVIKYKLLAFATGAAIASLGGAVFATKIGSVFPLSFGLLVSIQALALIVLGGMGSIPGVIVGAIVLVGLPELLRDVAGEYRLLFYGAILVAIMVTKPEGLIPSARRRAELHVEEAPEAQYERRAGEEAGAPVVTAEPEEAR